MSERTLIGGAGIEVAPSDESRARENPPESLLQAMAECWRLRHLLYVLVWRDLKVRYKQTLLGAAWAVLQPFLAMVVLTLVFARFAGIPSGRAPYPVFVFCGLLPWQFFAQGLSRAGASVVENRLLVNRLRIPNLLLPVSAVLVGLPDLGIAFVMLLAIMLCYGMVPTAAVLCVIPLLALAAVTALALGLFLSAVNVRYRDVGYTIPFLTQLYFFMTPVVYPIHLVPERWRGIFELNPMAVVVESLRWALVGSEGIAARPMVYSILGVLGVLWLGLRHFHAAEAGFADLV